MCRVAINHDLLTEPLVTLSVLLGIDGVPLHLAHFAKLWIDVYQTKVGRPGAPAGGRGLGGGQVGGWRRALEEVLSFSSRLN